MPSGYKNSAGTDLDDIFYSDNGNAGALGFKNSSNVDLGNKYTDVSTLGYAVGYRNSAGTDMGYLRGDYVFPLYGDNYVYFSEGGDGYGTGDGSAYGYYTDCYFGKDNSVSYRYQTRIEASHSESYRNGYLTDSSSTWQYYNYETGEKYTVYSMTIDGANFLNIDDIFSYVRDRYSTNGGSSTNYWSVEQCYISEVLYY